MTIHRGVAQPGSASALGAEGRRFKSFRPDHKDTWFFDVVGEANFTGILAPDMAWIWERH